MKSASEKYKAYRTEFLRENGNRCAYCGIEIQDIESFHIDHITPRSRGGAPWDRLNQTVSCCKCNLRKSNLTPPEFVEKMKKEKKELLAQLNYCNRVIKHFRES